MPTYHPINHDEAPVIWAMALDSLRAIEAQWLADWPHKDMTSREQATLARARKSLEEAQEAMIDLSNLVSGRSKSHGHHNPAFIKARNRRGKKP